MVFFNGKVQACLFCEALGLRSKFKHEHGGWKISSLAAIETALN